VFAHWPGVYLKIIESSTGYIPGFVSSGHADLGLTFSDEASVDLRFQHLIDEELVVVSPPLAKRGKHGKHGKRASSELAALPTITLRALSALPLVLPGNPHSLRRLLDQYQQREQVEFRVIAEANAIPQLIELAQAGVAHTILSFEAVRQEAERGLVQLRRISRPRLTRPVFLCRSDVLPLSLAAAAVADHVARIITDAGPAAARA